MSQIHPVSKGSSLPIATNPAPYETRVRDVMTHRVATARDTDTLAFASQILRWRGLRHLPVVDKDEHLVGILSERDLLRYVSEGPAGSLLLREIMTSEVETIGPDADLTEASAKLCIARIDCLPVVRGRALVGILTTTDVLAERGKVAGKTGLARVPMAADVMNRRLLVAHPGDSLLSVIQKLVDAEIRHIPVVDEDFRVVGIISDRDIRTAVGDPRAVLEQADDAGVEAIVADQVMTVKPRAVSPETSVLELADLFLDERMGAIPVVSADDKLLGIVSYIDVISHFVGRRAAS